VYTSLCFVWSSGVGSSDLFFFFFFDSSVFIVIFYAVHLADDRRQSLYV